jgi:hypothetical protein
VTGECQSSALAASTAPPVVEQVSAGEYTGLLIEGSSGFVASYPLASRMVLVMTSRNGVTLGLFSTTAKRVLSRLRPLAVEVGEWAPTASRPSVEPLPLEDIPRIDLSMVDKGRTGSRRDRLRYSNTP